MAHQKPNGQPHASQLEELEERLVEKFDTQIASRDSIIRALEATLDAVNESNRRIQAKLDSEWSRVKGLFVVGAAILALVFGRHLIHEQFAASDLKQQAKDLRDLTDSSRKEFEITKSEGAAKTKELEEAIKRSGETLAKA